jgi:hypothetical protein
MSSVYEKTSVGYKRTDWGKIKALLKLGNEIHIRPATKAEKTYFLSVLKELQ